MPTEPSPLAGDLIRAVELLAEAFAERSIRYALVGGLATMMRGRPRFTQDVDMLLEVPQLGLPPLLETLTERGFTIDVPLAAREFLRDHLTAFRYGAVRVDWLQPVLPLYRRTLADATDLLWTEGHKLRVATPEGLILTKMIAFREQDKADILTLLAANQSSLNAELIRDQWRPYADLEPARTAWLEESLTCITPPSPPVG